MNCVICGRDRISKNEGRIIDRSWRKDEKVLDRYIGK